MLSLKQDDELASSNIVSETVTLDYVRTFENILVDFGFFIWVGLKSGDGGIRTHETFKGSTSLAVRCFRPAQPRLRIRPR